MKHVQLGQKFSEDIKLLDENHIEIDSLLLSNQDNVVRELMNLKPILTNEEKNSLQKQLASYTQLSEMEANSKCNFLLANSFLRSFYY